jgi:hypothetical protein
LDFRQGRGTVCLLPGGQNNRSKSACSSPLAGDGKIYTISLEGKVTVIRAGAQWEVLRTNDLGDEVLATRAVAESRIYVRTRGLMYCFGKK